jgi:hypothetical protein
MSNYSDPQHIPFLLCSSISWNTLFSNTRNLVFVWKNSQFKNHKKITLNCLTGTTPQPNFSNHNKILNAFKLQTLHFLLHQKYEAIPGNQTRCFESAINFPNENRGKYAANFVEERQVHK